MRICYAQNKHTILIYSLEPPTTQKWWFFLYAKKTKGGASEENYTINHRHIIVPNVGTCRAN